MGEAPDDEPDDSPRRLTRRRIIVLAVVGSLVVVVVAVGVAVWQLLDPPTLTEQVAAVPGLSEEEAAGMVGRLQSNPDAMELLLGACEEGISVRGFGALEAARNSVTRYGRQREVIAAVSEIIYKYYCPDAVGS